MEKLTKALEINNFLVMHKFTISQVEPFNHFSSVKVIYTNKETPDRAVIIWIRPIDQDKWNRFNIILDDKIRTIQLLLGQFCVFSAFISGPISNCAANIGDTALHGLILSNKNKYKLNLFNKAFLIQNSTKTISTKILRRNAALRKQMKRFEDFLAEEGYFLQKKNFYSTKERLFGLLIQYQYEKVIDGLKRIIFISYDVLQGNVTVFGSHCKFDNDIRYMSVDTFKKLLNK